MKILVDEMPKCVEECPFSRIKCKNDNFTPDYNVCIIDARRCDSVSKCRKFKPLEKPVKDDCK